MLEENKQLTKQEQLTRELSSFYGTENHYLHELPFGNSDRSKMYYTDGVKYFFEKAGCYWFADIVVTEILPFLNQENNEEWKQFCTIDLEVFPDSTAEVVIGDGNENVKSMKTIQFTDCPEGNWSFWFVPHYVVGGVMYLPTEH